MKKKLEADLISIAHRILKLKNKSDINQLYLETQKLYEKLAVLKFIDENFNDLKPTIGYSEITSEVESIFDTEETIPTEPQTESEVKEMAPAETNESEKPETAIEEAAEPITETTEEPLPAEVVEEIIETTEEPIAVQVVEQNAEQAEEPIAEESIEPALEKIDEPIFEAKKTDEFSFTTVSDLNPIPDFKPAFELDKTEEKVAEKEETKTETPSKTGPIAINFEDFGINYAEAQFVKVDSLENIIPTPVVNEVKQEKTPIETVVLETPTDPKTVTLNEKLAKGFHVDLNDRIAFTKNLFGNSSEDYSRVLNQLLTFDTYSEAQEFIENMVKPDYNNWEGKDDYAERFLGIVEKKFS